MLIFNGRSCDVTDMGSLKTSNYFILGGRKGTIVRNSLISIINQGDSVPEQHWTDGSKIISVENRSDLAGFGVSVGFIDDENFTIGTRVSTPRGYYAVIMTTNKGEKSFVIKVI